MQIDGADVSTEDFVNLGSECVFLSHGMAREKKQAGCVAIRNMRGSVRGGQAKCAARAASTRRHLVRSCLLWWERAI